MNLVSSNHPCSHRVLVHISLPFIIRPGVEILLLFSFFYYHDTVNQTWKGSMCRLQTRSFLLPCLSDVLSLSSRLFCGFAVHPCRGRAVWMCSYRWLCLAPFSAARQVWWPRLSLSPSIPAPLGTWEPTGEFISGSTSLKISVKRSHK